MAYQFAETRGAPGAPLILTFHGTGGDETQFHGLARQILPDAHVISPCGDVSEMGMNRYFRRTGEGVYDMDDLVRRTEAMAAFISGAKARVGATRAIGFGYSNGANILASVAFQRPGLFAGIALLHPLIPWTPDPEPRLGGTNVLITAGWRDPICPAPLTEALADWFAAQGATPRMLWHPGGHELIQDEVQGLADFLRQAESAAPV
ncbi:MAG: alpha/beta hydrolase [Rhodobacter sp.]|nr:alpha/beta hydrolase [Rhodobacter sp.]